MFDALSRIARGIARLVKIDEDRLAVEREQLELIRQFVNENSTTPDKLVVVTKKR